MSASAQPLNGPQSRHKAPRSDFKRFSAREPQEMLCGACERPYLKRFHGDHRDRSDLCPTCATEASERS